jgi:hypothetical protein
MQTWLRRRIDLINMLNMLVGYCSRYGSMQYAFSLTLLADFADDVAVIPFHLRRAQWVKDRVN